MSDTTSTLSETLISVGPIINELRDYRDDISEMKADIAQNAAAIAALGGNSSAFTNLTERLAALSS